MQVHITSCDREVWNVIGNGSFMPKMINNEGVEVPKPKSHWTTDDEKKWNYDWKAKNILIYSLGVDMYCCISHCNLAKEM
jgi:hypothetical protein